LSCAGAGTLYGEAGDDVLGTSDANVFNLDTEMHGGVANDTYIVNDFQDLVVESDGEGTDLVQAFISYTLIGSVENLRLMGSDGINGTGNGLANVITGNEQANVLTGGDGNDTLVGLGGDDVYVLGAGDAADKIVEAAKGGSDTVQTSLVSTILAANVEVLQLQSGALNGTGNALDNEIDGTTGANTLDGAAGNDFLEGDAGDDQLIGGAGNDRLIGGDGSDAMTGGSGNDFYLVADAGDTVVEAKSQGTDEILALFDFDLSISGVNVENLTLFALGSGVTGSGNDLDNVIAGNSADNVLSGGKGDDTLQGDLGADTLDGGAGDDSLDGGKGDDAMAGGIGDDTYFVNSAGDGITEIPGAGTDLVVASVGWTLGAALENLTLTGGVGLIGIGNELANVITGTEGNDSLRGGAGNDTLIGGAGNDTYVLAAGDLHDKITEAANGGTDTVLSALDHTTLGANLEKLTLQGSGVDGTGNALDNALHGDALDNHLDGAAGNDNLNGGAGDDTLTGGAGDDTLNDDSGADHMIGGAGNDSYVVDDINDAVTELANLGTDIVTSLVSFNLAVQGANVENLSLSGGGNISGTGNDLANVITGNAGSNAIDGEKGADTLVGLDGNDFLFGGDGNDVIEGDRGADVLNGGDGGDVFLFRLSGVGALADIAGDTIQDFQTGEDRIDIRDLFDTYGIGSSSDPFADGHLALEASGGNTLVKFDSDGGGDSYVVLATATNATVAAADVVF
jgi:Ca2+-binding RTX toxin-like protein